MSKSFAQLMQEDRRLVILRCLSESTAYKANSSMMTAWLDHLGHAVSRDSVKTDLYWLAEQQLVTLASATDDGSVITAQLTERGVDVARGVAQVPGVSRPRP